jgi:hypothetical protein
MFFFCYDWIVVLQACGDWQIVLDTWSQGLVLPNQGRWIEISSLQYTNSKRENMPVTTLGLSKVRIIVILMSLSLLKRPLQEICYPLFFPYFRLSWFRNLISVDTNKILLTRIFLHCDFFVLRGTLMEIWSGITLCCKVGWYAFLLDLAIWYNIVITVANQPN